MRAIRPAARPGFTLIELLVVIGIISVLATIGYMTLPSLAGDYNRTRSIDALSEWLLTAKMRAKRDGTATGIRLNPASLDPTTGCYTQVIYIQQPDALTSGTWTGSTCNGIAANPAGSVATFSAPTNLFGPGVGANDPNNLVQTGDYLEIFGSGAVHQIASVPSPTQLNLANTNVNAAATGNFRILRGPRILGGEEVKQLPANMAINPALSLNGSLGNGLPSRTVPGAPLPYYEILFAPSGAIVGQGTGAGKVVLFVQDNNQLQTPGQPTLISIDVRSGFIGAFPVNPVGDPYQFIYSGAPGGL
jgi:prepilin-type N-terminal cleavage/methylation domain-containing protein